MPVAVFAQNEELPSAPESPVSEAAYWQFVEDSLAYVSPLSERDEEAFERLADGWASISAVTLPNNKILPIDHSDLVASIREDELDTIYNRLAILHDLDAELRIEEPEEDEALDDEESEPLGVLPEFSPDNPEMTEESLDDILSRPKFQIDETTAVENDTMQRFWRRFLNWFSSLFAGVGQIPFLRELMIGLGFIILLGIVGIALWQLRRNVQQGEVVEYDEFELERQLGSQGALEKAQNLSGEGDYRTAVRYLYLSTLLELESRNLLSYDRSRTNREYLRDIADKPELATLLKDVVGVFDAVWYGYEPLSESAYSAYQQRVEALTQR